MQLAPEQLACALELNQRAWISSLGALRDVQLHQDPDVTWTCSRTPGRPNAVVAAQFSDRATDRRIEAIVRRYQAIGAPITWWVGPSSTPTDLGRRLRNVGFHCFKHFPGMAIDTRAMRADPPAPRGLKIQPIDDFSIFQRHEHPYIGPITTERRRNLLENHRFVCSRRPRRAWALVAWLEGRPVGHAIAFRAERVIGIYEVGVIKRFRRRGIGSAITRAALEIASGRAGRYGILQASGDGESMYRRIGFTEVCRMSLWYYSRHHHAAPS